MKISINMLAALAAISVAAPLRAQAPEEAGVRAALDHYFKGHETGDANHFRKAFHPDAKLFSVADGKLAQLTSEEYAARASGKPAPDEAQRKRSVDSIDITGDAAVAKVVLDYPSVKFVDYMSLHKIDGEWRITNKSFQRLPPTPR
ncbi:MAG TPA: nuclear transport factor 2 family protein [Allosphingosinicella sp.]|uniref:nuclear transport factor 2 family protein n=1 Tax=Allosphingosinicella sp. TaxID=2823234 RepID=UPI002ED8DD68